MNSLKKIIFFFLLAFPAVTILCAQETPSSRFEKGVKYYTEADYNEALNTWLDIYKTGYRSAALNYNIGNAYFKLNNIPGAILF